MSESLCNIERYNARRLPRTDCPRNLSKTSISYAVVSHRTTSIAFMSTAPNSVSDDHDHTSARRENTFYLKRFLLRSLLVLEYRVQKLLFHIAGALCLGCCKTRPSFALDLLDWITIFTLFPEMPWNPYRK